MSRKSRWWGRRSTDTVETDAQDEQTEDVVAQSEENAQTARSSKNRDSSHRDPARPRPQERAGKASEPAQIKAAPAPPEDDADMTDDERSARDRAQQLESEAEEARLARVRAMEEITKLRQREREALERAMQEEVEADRAAQERIAAERSAAELAETEAAATERAAEERAAAEAAARRRADAEKLAKQHADAERLALENAAQELTNAERAAEARRKAEAQALGTGERERTTAARAAELRSRAEEAIDRRRASEKTVEELLARERASRARLAAERAAAARAAAERSLAAQRALEKAQADLAAAEREAAERAQAARSIAERLARAQAQAERAQSALGTAEHTLAELEDNQEDESALEGEQTLSELSADGDDDESSDSAQGESAKSQSGSAAAAQQDDSSDSDSGDSNGDARPTAHGNSGKQARRAQSGSVAALRRGAQPLAVLALALLGASTLAFHDSEPEVSMQPKPGAPLSAALRTPAMLASMGFSPASMELGRSKPDSLSGRASGSLATRDPAAAGPETPHAPAWLRNSVTPRSVGSGPMIALVIDDMGVDARLSARTIEMPAPLTLAFLPYAERVAEQAQRAKTAGHELLIHVPMEPNDHAEDPGPNALRVRLEIPEIERRLTWAFERVPGVVGINNHMGSRFTRDPDRMQAVVAQLRERELMFLDSMTSPNSVAWQLAREASVPYTARDVFLDHESDLSHIRGQLVALERQARREGAAVGIGHPRPNTLRALRSWLPEAAARGIRFVPITTIVRHQRGL